MSETGTSTTDAEVRPSASRINGSMPWCLRVNRHRHNPDCPAPLAVKHFTARAVEIDCGGDEPIKGRVLSVEHHPDVWDIDPSFSLKVILWRGRVVTLPYAFVMAGHVWTMEHGAECGCDVE